MSMFPKQFHFIVKDGMLASANLVIIVYDNAAMENFFGILKCECLYRTHYFTKAEVEQLVGEYVYFYNYERINLKDGLTPVEIRSKAA